MRRKLFTNVLAVRKHGPNYIGSTVYSIPTTGYSETMTPVKRESVRITFNLTTGS